MKKIKEKEIQKHNPAKIIAYLNCKMLVEKDKYGEQWFIDMNNIETNESIKTFWMNKLE